MPRTRIAKQLLMYHYTLRGQQQQNWLMTGHLAILKPSRVLEMSWLQERLDWRNQSMGGMEFGDVLTLWELQSNCAWSKWYKYHLDLQWRLISISENCLSKVFLKLKESIISDTSIKDLQTDKATTLSIDVSTTISKSSYSARFGRRTQASLAAAPVRKLVSQFRVLLDFRSTLNACQYSPPTSTKGKILPSLDSGAERLPVLQF